jgi:hypothetical protein
MKTNEKFNLTKTTKRIMASIVSKDLRDGFRQAMIQAQLASEQKPVKEKTDKR